MKELWPISNADFYAISSGQTIEIMNDARLDKEFYKYAVQFHNAAHLIATHLCQTNINIELDAYFLPLAFLYRHSLELLLKSIGFQYITCQNDRVDFISTNAHDLLLIFNEICPYTAGLIPQSALEWLNNYFESSTDIDKKSDSFRFPFCVSMQKDCFENKTYGIQVVFDEQANISLVEFASKAEIAVALLKAVYNKTKLRDDFAAYSPTFLHTTTPPYVMSVIGRSFNFARFYPFVTAFTEAAQHLYYEIISSENLGASFFIPMCYLYRNSIELSLKGILFEEYSLDSQEMLRRVKKAKHSLLKLWNLALPIIKKHTGHDDILTTVDMDYIKKLHAVDGPDADLFRYPADKNLRLYFAEKSKFDIQNVNNFFLELHTFLSSVTLMLSAHNDSLAEMAANCLW